MSRDPSNAVRKLLLGRRLIEAGVRRVSVSLSDFHTHANRLSRMRQLLPIVDHALHALVTDLDNRGMLEDVAIVVWGEFGRTPRINGLGGRDHWGRVFSFAMAGAGIAGGQVFGTSDRQGAFPATDPIRPHDLTATIFHLLGIDPAGVFYDKSNQPHFLTRGEPLFRLLGTEPATLERCQSGGDRAFVPAYHTRLLLDTDFQSGLPLISATPPTRERGWRASPLWDAAIRNAFSVRLTEEQRVVLGFGMGDGLAAPSMTQGNRVLLAQEIRNARGGHFTFTVQASGGGASREFFERVFLAHFTCRLMLFRYANTNKDPNQVTVLAAADFRPAFSDGATAAAFEVNRFLGSIQPNVNFPIGNGLGVAVVVEKTSPGTLSFPGTGPFQAFLRVHAVALEFNARPRDDSVTV